MKNFYLSTLPRWYVWLVMDAGCALFGHPGAFMCWNGRNWRSRLFNWANEAPLPGEEHGGHSLLKVPVAISNAVRWHYWQR